MDTITVRAYVDGACRGNPSIYGACGGVVYWPDNRETEFSYIEGDITNNTRMEIKAVIDAVYHVRKELRRMRCRAALFIFSDCQNVVQCATKHSMTHSNTDLWQRYHAAITDFPGTIAVQWVPRDDNERADAIVTQAIEGMLV